MTMSHFGSRGSGSRKFCPRPPPIAPRPESAVISKSFTSPVWRLPLGAGGQLIASSSARSAFCGMTPT